MTIMPAMRDVLRLTKEGRLAEATALLSGGLVRTARGSSGGATRPTAEGVSPSLMTAGAPTAPGQFDWREVADAAGRRRYKLYTPRAATDGPRPLLLMLHGCSQTPDDFAAGTGMNAVADAHGVLVAYPEQTSAHNRSRCWNWFRPGDQRRGGGEASVLAAVVDDVARDVAVDRSRVFVAGLSAGGAAAAILADAYPDVFAGVGVHSGLACGAASNLPSALAAMKTGAPARSASPRPVPTIVFHGSADRTVAPVNARHVLAGATAGLAAPDVERGRASGGEGYVREIWRDAEGRLRAEFWSVEGAGHAWSGGSPAGSYADPRGPDASREMVRFFLGLR